jgi:hypothetical protein
MIEEPKRHSKALLFLHGMFELIHTFTGLHGRTREQHANTQTVRATHTFSVKMKSESVP